MYPSARGLSSAGRALAWHARGRGFDPPRLHSPAPHPLAERGWAEWLGCPGAISSKAIAVRRRTPTLRHRPGPRAPTRAPRADHGTSGTLSRSSVDQRRQRIGRACAGSSVGVIVGLSSTGVAAMAPRVQPDSGPRADTRVAPPAHRLRELNQHPSAGPHHGRESAIGMPPAAKPPPHFRSPIARLMHPTPGRCPRLGCSLRRANSDRTSRTL